MKVHIVGAGPTGMSLAWEILRSGEHDITIYDRKTSAGGSWWEPEEGPRDLHAHRIVFDKAFVNTQSLFGEMGINWNDIFEPAEKDLYSFILDSLKLKDYGALTSLATRVLAQPQKYKSVSLKEALGEMTEGGQAVLEHLPLIMDGVTWDVMSAYEFVKSFDHVALSKQYTQKVSGRVMSDGMQEALEKVGVEFQFGKELREVEYLPNGFKAVFGDETQIEDGMLFLCLDNSPALKFLGDNWGPDAEKKVRESTYGCINVLFDFDEPVELADDLKIAATTRLNLQPVVLADGHTVSCVICDLTEEILTTPPEELRVRILEELDVPLPKQIRIGWVLNGMVGDGSFPNHQGFSVSMDNFPSLGNVQVSLCVV